MAGVRMIAPTTDTLVRCEKCGHQHWVNFSDCLRTGWPKHCGATMYLVHSEADIGAAVGDAFAPAKRAVEAARGAIEQDLENEQVRRLQREGRCPTCGAEQ
jgi:predicted  nucleic acid-binding Zn-ribbon protein